MRYPYFLLVGAFLFATSAAHSQVIRARSLDYLFTSAADDARALWVNPAGLGAVPEASIMAEVVVDQPEGGDIRVAQWSAGFNARGFSVGYVRQRIEADANQEFRFGLGRGTRRGAVGLSFSLYRSDETETAWDVGFRYSLVPAIELALVLRNIGQPAIRQQKLPATGVLAFSWRPLPKVVALSAEVLAQNRILESGLDMAYRTGGRLSVGTQFPFTGLVALDFDSGLELYRWSLGLAIGGNRRGIAVATLPQSPSLERDLLSITGLATNR